MIFNTLQEQKLGEQLVDKLKNIDNFFIVSKIFHSSIQNFLMHNQSAIESRDLQKFDPVCIMNGIHSISKPIETLFQLSECNPTYLWMLMYFMLIVYSPFHELSEEEVYEINTFLGNNGV